MALDWKTIMMLYLPIVNTVVISVWIVSKMISLKQVKVSLAVGLQLLVFH